jgi:hypothetical protein
MALRPRNDARSRGHASYNNVIAPKHSTPEITREIYLHAIPKEQSRAVESVERLLFGPKWTQIQAPTETTSDRVN